MKNKESTSSSAGGVIAAICIVIYLFALVQASVRLYLSIEKQKDYAEQEFLRISNIALAAGIQGFFNDHFIETMNGTLSESQTIEAIIITDSEGDHVFEKQKGKAVTWVNNTPRFANRFDLSGKGYYRPLPMDNARNVNIRAVAGAFDYSEVTKILKETIFIVLIGFILAFFTIFIQLLIGKPSGKTQDRKNYVKDDTNDNIDDVFNLQPEPPLTTSPINKTLSEIDFDAANKTLSETRLPAQNIPKKQEIRINDTDNLTALKSAPKTLYSPRTNLRWEENLEETLTDELHRCAASEKDLSVITMEFSGKMNDKEFQQAAEETASFFALKEMLFERGKQGITIIYSHFDIDTSLNKAQKLHQYLAEKIIFNSRDKKCLCIGLSSRSGRLVDSARLLMEANEALKKAKTDSDAPIIAFKSDPEKYRKYIAGITKN